MLEFNTTDELKPNTELLELIKDNDYYRIAKEDIDTIISESISSKQFLDKLNQLGYQYYIKYDKLTIYKENLLALLF